MAQDLLTKFTNSLVDSVQQASPLVESTCSNGSVWRLYRTYNKGTFAKEQGLYATTREKESSEDGEQLIRYGIPEDARFSTPKYVYLQNSPDEYSDLINKYFSYIENAELNTMRSAFDAAFSNPSESLTAIENRHLYVSVDSVDVTTVGKLAQLDSQCLGDSEITKEEYEEVDWETLSEVVKEARLEWWREKADGAVADDWKGVPLLIDYDDWRKSASELTIHTNLSDGQALSTAVASRNFSISKTAEILEKDTSVVSRQVGQAMTKLVKAEQTVEKLGGLKSRTLEDPYYNAKMDHDSEVEDAKYERRKSPNVGFYLCPNCGLDTGPFSGPLDDGEFESDDPPEFITGSYNHPHSEGRRGPTVKVECPTCEHSDWESSFEQAWMDEHGKIPEPKNPPEPY